MKRLLVAFLLLFSLVTPVKWVGAEENYRLDAWLNKLAKCESAGNDRVEIIDRNGLFSRGRYQYQDATFLKYVRKYNLLPFTEDREVQNFVLDGAFQTKLTRLVVQDVGSGDWVNCSKAIGPI